MVVVERQVNQLDVYNIKDYSNFILSNIRTRYKNVVL
jgi:hypothetical protein